MTNTFSSRNFINSLQNGFWKIRPILMECNLEKRQGWTMIACCLIASGQVVQTSKHKKEITDEVCLRNLSMKLPHYPKIGGSIKSPHRVIASERSRNKSFFSCRNLNKQRPTKGGVISTIIVEWGLSAHCTHFPFFFGIPFWYRNRMWTSWFFSTLCIIAWWLLRCKKLILAKKQVTKLFAFLRSTLLVY